MKELCKLLLAFSPWIAFLLIAGHSMLRLQIGLVAAAVITVILAIKKIHRGAIAWAGYIFFSIALIMVLLLKNMWFIGHIGLLANGTLLFFTIIGMMWGKPFTEEYAREAVPEDLWNTPAFIKSSYITTTLWMLVFLMNFLADVARTDFPDIAPWKFKVFNYTMLLGGVIATRIYVIIKKYKSSYIVDATTES